MSLKEWKNKLIILMVLIACFVFILHGIIKDSLKEHEDSKSVWETAKEQTAQEYETVAPVSEKPDIKLEDGEVSIGNLKMKIPAEFEEIKEGFYAAPGGSNISFIFESYPGQVLIFPNEKEVKESVEADVLKVVKQEIEAEISRYEIYEIDGYAALRYTAEYDIGSISFVYTACTVIVEGNNVVLISFTTSDDSVWKDAFEESIASITME